MRNWPWIAARQQFPKQFGPSECAVRDQYRHKLILFCARESLNANSTLSAIQHDCFIGYDWRSQSLSTSQLSPVRQRE